jgi:PAS domain S-box-containing protein
MPSDQVQHLLHELREHQIELELQNEELRIAQLALEVERSRYFDLYDLAPVAYCTLSDQGFILQANLTSANLLGMPRPALLKRSFSGFIHCACQDVYYHHCKQLASTFESQTCQLRMVKANGDMFWGNLVSAVQEHADGTMLQRLVISDISQHQRASLAERKTELARSLLQSQEQSRHQFSSVLHDRTSANLAALRMNLELILATAAPARDTPAFTDCVADTWALLEDTNTGIRDICQDLHPPAFDLGGLTAAVQSYARAIYKRTGLKVDITCAHPKVDLPNELELALFRIVQEALTNCVKHARASVVRVNLQLDTQPLRISIADDGIGFEPQAPVEVSAPGAPRSPGQGLRHMRQAAEFFNAVFCIDSAPGRGTLISLEIQHPAERGRL